MRNRICVGLIAVSAGLLGGCGGVVGTGANDVKKTEKAAITAPSEPVKEQVSLLGDSGSAGTDESYEPTGDIVADSGFRPDVDGFGFENYGNDVQPENMTPYEVEDIFGEDVCVRGTGVDCELSPLAKKWMDTQNEAMAGGHCMGFSVLALRMFTKAVKAKDYGAAEPIDLPIQGNTDLQSAIAESWTYQNLPAIQEGVVEGTPNEVVATLEDALNSGDEQYTLAIYRADGGGGHAITPFAVEDKGDGTKEILVYDNNFPGIIRKVDLDTEADTWHYVGGTNPKDLDEVYEGDADTQSLSLYPNSPGEEYQPCPFCGDGDGGSEDPQPDTDSTNDTGSTLGAAKEYNEIRLHSGRKNHPHLILTDEKGRQTGIVGGKLINNIPGVEIDRNLAVQNWDETPEPAYRTPVGLPMAVSVDGSDLKKKVTANVTLSGAGLAVEVDEIKLKPGQTDYIEFLGSGLGLTYETDPSSTTSPDLYATLEDGDVSKGGGYYVIGVTALGFSAGSRIGFTVDQENGKFELDTEGTKPSRQSDGLGGKSLYGVTMVREKASGTAQWLTDPIALKGGKVGERLRIDYRHAVGGQNLKVVGGPPGGPFKTYKGKPEK